MSLIRKRIKQQKIKCDLYLFKKYQSPFFISFLNLNLIIIMRAV